MSLFALVMSAVAAEQNECRFAAIKLPNWVLTFEAESQKCGAGLPFESQDRAVQHDGSEVIRARIE
jgi:hypothetical protein